MNSNKSGNKANGPKPVGRKPNNQIINGFDDKSLIRNAEVKINNPKVNFDLVFLKISIFIATRRTRSAKLSEETTVCAM